MAYYGYMRVSTETQVEKGFGLDAQQSEIEKYAKANGIEITEWFIDAGKSGAAKDTAEDNEAISKRGELLRMLAVITEDDTIIVLNTSRLWRSTTAMVVIRREIMKQKAKLISVEQPRYDLYSIDPNDRLIAAIMEALDEWERASIALKLARGRTVKARNGDKPAGICPFGYQYSADKKSVEINDQEAGIVRCMFTEAQKGQTLQEIADILNAKGSKTRMGKEWQKGTIRAILRNRFYIGELTHQGKPIQGNHTPIISKIQFGKASAQLSRRHK